MKLEDIWNKIKTILEEDVVLSTYIKIVYSGTRDNIPVNNFPCIIPVSYTHLTLPTILRV